MSPEFGFDVGAPEQHSLDAGFSEAIQVSGKAGEDDDDEAVHPSKDAMSREMPSLEEDEESVESLLELSMVFSVRFETDGVEAAGACTAPSKMLGL